MSQKEPTDIFKEELKTEYLEPKILTSEEVKEEVSDVVISTIFTDKDGNEIEVLNYPPDKDKEVVDKVTIEPVTPPDPKDCSENDQTESEETFIKEKDDSDEEKDDSDEEDVVKLRAELKKLKQAYEDQGEVRDLKRKIRLYKQALKHKSSYSDSLISRGDVNWGGSISSTVPYLTISSDPYSFYNTTATYPYSTSYNLTWNV
jgi:hypothetical protein